MAEINENEIRKEKSGRRKTAKKSRTGKAGGKSRPVRRSEARKAVGKKSGNTAGKRNVRPASSDGRKKTGKKRRAVRRKETAFQKYFQKIGGAAAFVLLILSTILTGLNASGVKKAAEAVSEPVPGTEVEAVQVQPEQNIEQPVVTETPVPTERPKALPIPDNVPEWNPPGFLMNGVSSKDGQSVTVLCGGDNLIHEAIFQSARTESGFDFNYLYDNLRGFIQSADIATINQEAPLATDIGEPSGYPLFNTPKEAGEALVEAGFDVINICNNHIYDQGSEGALVTEQFFQNRNIPVVGFYRSEEDFHNIRIVDCNGIKVAFLSFVEYTNIEPDDEEKGFVVTMEDRSMIQTQIEEARSQADIVVVHAHWGEEGTTELTDGQVEMANLMVNWGADIIYGNHPHVIQQLTTITRDSDSQICPVIFSMGNFVSAQTHRPELVSAMLAVKVTRDANGVPRPTAMGVMPVVTHYVSPDKSDVVLYPLAAYPEELARSHAVNAMDGEFSLEYINGLVSAQIPERYLYRLSSLTN